MLCKNSFVWFRFWRRKTYPWQTLAIASCKIVWMCGEQDREKTRLMLALTKIDFVGVYSLLNDLLW